MRFDRSAVVVMMLGAAVSQVAAGFQSRPASRIGAPHRILGGTSPKLIYAPEPRTPRLAKLARLRGAVRMVAEIDEEGAVASLVIQEGHPFLIPAAMEAAQRYRYKPGFVCRSGQPEMRPARFIVPITVEFRIDITPVVPVPVN